MLVVDVHNHINVEQWVKEALKGEQEVTVYERGVPLVTWHPGHYQIDERVEGMDTAGIDVTLLYRPHGWNNSLENCRVLNDYVGKAVKKFPKRLAGAAHVPPLAGEKALDELKRCIYDLGLKAVTLSSSLNGIPLDSRDLWPFYREVAKMDIPVFVHPAMPLDYTLCRRYDLQRLIGREFDLMLGFTSMIYGGVFEEFPALKVVFSHLGGGISGLKGRLRATQPQFRPWIEETFGMKKSFDEYFAQIYFDTAGFIMSSNEIKCALINIGPDRILFGTDYPADYRDYESVRKFKEIVLDIPMSEGDRVKMMGGNAAKLLRL